MDTNSLQQQIASMRQSFFDEEIFNDQFIVMEALANKGCPNFVKRAIDMYFSDSSKIIERIEQTLEDTSLDRIIVMDYFLEFRRKNEGIGVHKVNIEVYNMEACYWGGDMEGCRAAFERLKQDYKTLKNRVEAYLELLRQASTLADQSSSSRNNING